MGLGWTSDLFFFFHTPYHKIEMYITKGLVPELWRQQDEGERIKQHSRNNNERCAASPFSPPTRNSSCPKTS